MCEYVIEGYERVKEAADFKGAIPKAQARADTDRCKEKSVGTR
jgi:hypothetical protein